MKLVWTRQHILVAIAGLFIVIGFLTFLFIRIVEPIQSELDQTEQQLANERQILSTLQQQVEGEEPSIRIESSVSLQQQLPVKPLIDQLLLALARAEGISDTYIRSINIEESDDVGFLTNDSEMEEEVEVEIEVEEEESFSLEVTEEEPSQTVVEVESLPTNIEGLRTIRFLVTVRAKDYEGVARFAEEIDTLERIMNVDSISYVSPEEQVQVDQELDPLEFFIVISSFYYPEANELKSESPMVDYPNSAGKRTPLYQE
ncbi:type II secretion system protein M [Halalkalibacter nanhaiisediminis]|uniref:Type IV pilus assembly protein PilO n=1 Tax=Halalkalibacter nanhaiisediminis TaxID=688079 RepID=A0A562QLN4_9BACI|nr:type II secretion system protein M [Halalkalibacter nanhaiisediminis]TWI57100.1 hypothetical protein IQ10_01803 [Halalkalibacter nanhaiisediminis]